MKALTVLMGLISAGCWFGAVAIYLDTQTFMRTASATMGTVEQGGAGGDKAMPGEDIVVRFTTDDGAEVLAGLDVQFWYRAGDTVRIAYQDDNPDDARLASFWELNLGVATLSVFGLLFGTVALGTFISSLLSAPGASAKPRRPRKIQFRFGVSPGTDDFSGGSGFRTHVDIRHRERIEVTNPVTGERQVYDSADEVPEQLRETLDAIRRNAQQGAGATFRKSSYTFTDTSGVQHTYQSIDEMPPEIRALFDHLRED